MVRQVQVRGRLPAVLLLLLLGALVGLVVFASLAVALPVAGGLLLLGLARSLWYRLTGRRPPPTVAVFRTVHVDPGWRGEGRVGPAGDEGPVVDALPRPARGAEPVQAGADQGAPGRFTGPGGQDGPDGPGH